jgi:hypothetical protein
VWCSWGYEEEVNIRIADVLSEEFGLNCRPERPSGRRRPDIRCYYRGFNIVIESSYDKNDAERDARRRIEEDGFDIAIALWLKEGDRYRSDLSTSELEKVIRSSRFDAAIFIQSPQSELLKFIAGRVRAKLSAGWFVDVDLNFIRDLIMHSIEYLIAEEEVEGAINEVNKKLTDFINVLRNQPESVWQGIYDILYRLYGLQLTEARDAEVIFGQAGLSILLSSTFYEHIRALHNLNSLNAYMSNYGPVQGLAKALEDLLRFDYRTAIETTIEILNILPPDVAGAVKKLVELGIELAQNRYLLRRDFAGRVYHRIVGDIVHRKGFATFYTEVPAAYLLATLAVNALFNTDEKPITKLSEKEVQNIVSKISNVKVGDFACGSGTLLTAAYSALMGLASAIKLYHNLNINLNDVGKRLIEDSVYGIDALRYASQITAINLALIGPPGKITRENVFTIYLGILNDPNVPHKGPWLGSLELLNNGKRVGGILAYIEGGLRGAVEKVSVNGGCFDVILLNEVDKARNVALSPLLQLLDHGGKLRITKSGKTTVIEAPWVRAIAAANPFNPRLRASNWWMPLMDRFVPIEVPQPSVDEILTFMGRVANTEMPSWVRELVEKYVDAITLRKAEQAAKYIAASLRRGRGEDAVRARVEKTLQTTRFITTRSK